MAATSAAVVVRDVCMVADENAFWDAVELGVKVPRRRNIAEGFSFDNLMACFSSEFVCVDNIA
jgi:hypothetical protein